MSVTRQRQREERRQEILDAADRLLAAGGLDGLSMRLLAREAGIPAPTLYGYFASKEAVIEALANQKLDLLEDAILGEAIDAEPGLPRLLAFAKGYRNHAHSGRDYYSLFMLHATGDQGDPLERTHDRVVALIRRLEGEVQLAVDLGHIPPMDPGEAIMALWSMVHGFVSLELSGAMDDLMAPGAGSEAAYLRFFEATLRGLGGGPGHTSVDDTETGG